MLHADVAHQFLPPLEFMQYSCCDCNKSSKNTQNSELLPKVAGRKAARASGLV